MTLKHIYLIIFGIWGLLFSIVIAFFLAGGTAGLLCFFLITENSFNLLSIIPNLVAISTVIIITTISALFGFKIGEKKDNWKKAYRILSITIIIFLIIKNPFRNMNDAHKIQSEVANKSE